MQEVTGSSPVSPIYGIDVTSFLGETYARQARFLEQVFSLPVSIQCQNHLEYSLSRISFWFIDNGGGCPTRSWPVIGSDVSTKPNPLPRQLVIHFRRRIQRKSVRSKL